MTHIWYDTEFHERGPAHPIDLISIGMIREDGEELYLVNGEMDFYAAWRHDWLRENVMEQLPLARDPDGIMEDDGLDFDHPAVVSRANIASQVSDFLKVPRLKLWAWYGAYDHVVLAQLFGRMIDLPGHVPMFTHDLKQEATRLHAPELPSQPAGEHNALADARHLRDRAQWLRDWADEQGKETNC